MVHSARSAPSAPVRRSWEPASHRPCKVDRRRHSVTTTECRHRSNQPCASTLTAIRVVAHRSAASGARPERWGRVSIGQNIPSRPFKTVPQGQVCGSTTFRARHVERVLHTCARCGMMPSSPGLGNSFVGTAVKNCLINVTSTPSGGSMRP